ncbi:MAG: sorbosone dehydrogenase family protein [Armatimonadetes bacterium]|nr:sorbosone dehydrogenase family protein [Armatimonadota bacterium]
MISPLKHPLKNPGYAKELLSVGAGFALLLTLAGGCAQAKSPAAEGTAKEAAPAKAAATGTKEAPLRVGREAFGDWREDAPGVRRHIRASDLPAPNATPSFNNGPRLVDRPEGAWPKVPAGFKVDVFATDLVEPRVIVTAPNGDLFVSESRANRIRLLRDTNGDGKPEVNTVFATGLNRPFGIAFYPVGRNPRWIYIANTDTVVRFPYKNGQTKTEAPPEKIVASLPEGGRLTGGGHWTRDIVFSKDGKKMFVSIGSRSNNDEEIPERAAIHEYNPDGSGYRLYATGIRNPVGIAIHPATGDLWTSVNERDGLGDNLPFEYVTRVKEGGFYGWPWYYIGPNWDPRYKGQRPELRDKVIIPDVLIQAHSASLDLAFYTGNKFPREYRNDIFAAEHGSWNREFRTGYKVIRIPLRDGRATGVYEDFMTGFVTPEGNVWGRPVGVTTGKDGSLMVTDDGSGTVWRVSYEGTGRSGSARRS